MSNEASEPFGKIFRLFFKPAESDKKNRKRLASEETHELQSKYRRLTSNHFPSVGEPRTYMIPVQKIPYRERNSEAFVGLTPLNNPKLNRNTYADVEFSDDEDEVILMTEYPANVRGETIYRHNNPTVGRPTAVMNGFSENTPKEVPRSGLRSLFMKPKPGPPPPMIPINRGALMLNSIPSLNPIVKNRYSVLSQRSNIPYDSHVTNGVRDYSETLRNSNVKWGETFERRNNGSHTVDRLEYTPQFKKNLNSVVTASRNNDERKKYIDLLRLCVPSLYSKPVNLSQIMKSSNKSLLKPPGSSSKSSSTPMLDRLPSKLVRLERPISNERPPERTSSNIPPTTSGPSQVRQIPKKLNNPPTNHPPVEVKSKGRFIQQSTPNIRRADETKIKMPERQPSQRDSKLNYPTTSRPETAGPSGIRQPSQHPSSSRPETAGPSGMRQPSNRLSSSRPEIAGPSGMRQPSKHPSSSRPETAGPSGMRQPSKHPSSSRPETAGPSGMRQPSKHPSSSRPDTAGPSGIRQPSNRPSSSRLEIAAPSGMRYPNIIVPAKTWTYRPSDDRSRDSEEKQLPTIKIVSPKQLNLKVSINRVESPANQSLFQDEELSNNPIMLTLERKTEGFSERSGTRVHTTEKHALKFHLRSPPNAEQLYLGDDKPNLIVIQVDEQDANRISASLLSVKQNEEPYAPINQRRSIHTPVEKSSTRYNDDEIIDLNDSASERRSPPPSVGKSLPEIQPVNSLKSKLLLEPTFRDGWLARINEKYVSKQEQRKQEITEQRESLNDLEEDTRKHVLGVNQKLQEFKLSDSIVIDDSEEEEEDEIELPELTEDHKSIIKQAVYGNPSDVVINKFNMNITKHDIRTLVGGTWLNDEVINFYMNLLMERSDLKQSEGYPRVYAMNTFFIPKLMKQGHDGVRRWTRKVDIFAYDIIPVPVHVGNMHWCMAIIHFAEKTIRYYDSMGTPNPRVLNALERYLCDESLDKKKCCYDLSDFVIESVGDSPRQLNGWDCGVFSCMNAEYITRNKALTFSQEDMSYFRQKMILEIATGKLML